MSRTLVERPNNRSSIPQQRHGFSLHSVQIGPRATQTPLHWVPGVGREATSSTGNKNAWCCASTPLYVFMAWRLVDLYPSGFHSGVHEDGCLLYLVTDVLNVGNDLPDRTAPHPRKQ